MKILELEIHNFRGIRELRLEPKGNNLLILGPNGSGKSSLVDAIDFLLTGRIARLTGKGTGKIYLNRHGPHIDCKPEEAIVSAKIDLAGFKEPVYLRRCIARPNQFDCDPKSAEGAIKELGKLAINGHHVLTRREILRYITAEEGTRAQEIQALLDLSDIEDLRKLFKKAQNESEKACDNSQRAVTTAKGQVNATTQLKRFDAADVLALVNRHRALLKGAPLGELSSRDLKTDLQPAAAASNEPQLQVSLIERDIQNLSNFLAPGGLAAFQEADLRLRDILYLLHANPELLLGYSRQKLLEMGLDMVDESGICPLCGTAWEPGRLVDHIEHELSRARLSQQYHAELAALSETVSAPISIALASVGKLAAAARLLDLPEASALEDWQTRLEKLSKALASPVESYALDRFDQQAVHRLLAPGQSAQILQSLAAAIKERFPSATPEQVSWDTLTRLEENLKALETASAEFACADLACRRATLLESAFETARNKVLGDLYEAIKERFVALYATLHDTDESVFSAVMKPDGAGLLLEVDFHGRGKHPPHAMHSEGHQDSMGLCLYLALAEHLTRGKIDTVILDDVVMSVDADHRRQLCKVFMKFFPNRQLIITTHDRTWAGQLRTEGVVTSKMTTEFYYWDLESGPRVNSTTDIWSLIDRDLSRNDVPAAAARLRRGSEEYFSTICEALQAQVRFKTAGRWELGELLPAAKTRYRELLGKASQAAQSWGKQNLMTEYTLLKAETALVFNRSDNEQGMINAAVHYNEWANLSKPDFEGVVEAFHALWDLFRCKDCGAVLRVSAADQVYCNCGTVSWNLREKPKTPAQ